MLISRVIDPAIYTDGLVEKVSPIAVNVIGERE